MNADRQYLGASPDLASRPRVSRMATWPIIGFLLGFTFQPGVLDGSGPRTFLLLSIVFALIGCGIATLAAMAAKLCSRRLGPTKTALPYSQGLWTALIFNASLILLTVSKMMLIRDGVALVIGFIPIWIVARGGRPRKGKPLPATASGDRETAA